MKLQELYQYSHQYPLRQQKMPVLFVGHGHPLNAVMDNGFTKALRQVGQQIEQPNAILVISAHWETVGTYVSHNPDPRTIYDFGKFDERLYQMSYDVPGAPEIAKELQELVTLTAVKKDMTMGLDHGAWTMLKFIRPAADVPVFEMSVDFTKSPEFHYQLGEQLKVLRNKGVLIVCSGNIVHNLKLSDWQNMDAKPHDWNIEFDQLVKQSLDQHDFRRLIHHHNLGSAARLSVPTTDHYLPMLYCLGMIDQDEDIRQFYEGYQFAGMSMRCFMAG